MITNFSPLAPQPLQLGVTIHRPDLITEQVTLDDPAITVMTDLRKVNAVTIDPTATIEMANQRMKQRGVRMLLIMDEQDAIIGLITLTDLQGEKPLQYIRMNGGTRSDILVKDIMTPQSKMEVLCMADVSRARVGNVVATLEAAGRQHALAVDCAGEDKSQVLRGIFSASQIARQLNMEIQTTKVAQTFAEIEELLMSA